MHHVVGQQHGERLVADQMARAPDRMAEAQRLLLAGIGDLARHGQQVVDQRQLALFLPRSRQGGMQLVGMVEMILDRASCRGR